MLPVGNPRVLYKALSDGAVLFSTADEVYFGLNAVGARVWELLPPVSRTMDELCSALAAAYPDVDIDTIRGDVIDLLSELARHGLVEYPSSSEQSNGESDADGAAKAAASESARVA